MKRKLLAAVLAGTLILQSGLAAAAEELLVEDACMAAEYCDDISEDEETGVEIADVETDESVEEAIELQTVEAGGSVEEAAELQAVETDESAEEAVEQTVEADVDNLSES